MPLASPKGTKRTSDGDMTTVAGKLFDTTGGSDLAYVTAQLQKTTLLVPYLASMLRDGVLEKALNEKLSGGQPEQLGRKLPNKARKFRNLPPRVWAAFLAKTMPSDVSLGSRKMDPATMQQVCAFALRVRMDDSLPSLHKAAAWENPMVHAMVRRYEDMGSLFQGMTQAKLDAGAFPSYFRIPQPFVGKLIYFNNAELNIVDAAKAASATDWVLVEFGTPEVSLVAKSIGFQQKLKFPLQSILNIQFPEHSAFEYADCANHFPDPKADLTSTVEDAPASAPVASLSSLPPPNRPRVSEAPSSSTPASQASSDSTG